MADHALFIYTILIIVVIVVVVVVIGFVGLVCNTDCTMYALRVEELTREQNRSVTYT
jgi:hypothetical protein